jgi:hypothetical protein
MYAEKCAYTYDEMDKGLVVGVVAYDVIGGGLGLT